MIRIQEPFQPESFYPGICPPDRKMLFFDIETTGFSREYHIIYLIGAAAFCDGKWTLMQWFAEHPGEEPQIIQEFLDFSADYDTLIHFNGQRFDLPFLKARASLWNLDDTLEFEESIDLMNRIKPYKELCGLPNCRQKSVEILLGISSREDVMSGGELIPVYERYVEYQRKSDLHLLLLHNADDVRGMTGLTRVAMWPDFFHSSFRLSHQESTDQWLVLHFLTDRKMPILLNAEIGSWQISAGGNSLSLGIRYLEGEKKHFYKNYKDYYYLPEEDLVIHKSVAEFVDKSHRKKATKQNCCIKKSGRFLPQPEILFTPEFAEKPGDKITCFSCEDWTPDETSAVTYLQSVLKHIKL